MSSELDAHVSISSKTNHATGVAINSGKLLHENGENRGNVTARYGCSVLYVHVSTDDSHSRYQFCTSSIWNRNINNYIYFHPFPVMFKNGEMENL